jgi:starch-binding outer membrane protein, SusD/RagB family
MKRASFLAIAITFTFCTAMLVSCSDFLDVDVQGGVTTESDPDLAQKLVTGVYNSLLLGDAFGSGDIHGFGFLSVSSIMSDDADKGSTPSDQAGTTGHIDDFTLTPTNKFAESLWNGHYRGIGSANQAIKALKIANVAAATKQRLTAEVRFIRGYLYFNLVRMYGQVPLVFRVPKDANDANNDPAFQTRAELSVVYDSIINDLEFAAGILPLRSAAAAGHINKGTAQSMLAKVYMYKASDPTVAAPANADWQNVLDLTDEVIASGEYALVDDYATIWRQAGENSSESIFEVQTGEFNNGNLSVGDYTVSQGPRVGGLGGWNDLGWGFNNPSTSLISAYETGDLRKNATIIFVDNSGTHAGTLLWDGFRLPSKDSVENLYYNYKAYTSTNPDPAKRGEQNQEEFSSYADKNRPKNIRILRYADVLLMYAEAAVVLGTGDPDTKINLIRERADLDPISGVTQLQVWNERRVELAMEHDRFWDLVRQGKIVPGRTATVMHEAGKLNFTEGKHELLPVPTSQILLSGNQLTQNPNY